MKKQTNTIDAAYLSRLFFSLWWAKQHWVSSRESALIMIERIMNEMPHNDMLGASEYFRKLSSQK